MILSAFCSLMFGSAVMSTEAARQLAALPVAADLGQIVGGANSRDLAPAGLNRSPVAEAPGNPVAEEPKVENAKIRYAHDWVVVNGSKLKLPGQLCTMLGLSKNNVALDAISVGYVDAQKNRNLFAVLQHEGKTVIVISLFLNGEAWVYRTSMEGKIEMTLHFADLSKPRGVVVPNEGQAERFEGQLVWWERKVRENTAVQNPAPKPAPSR